MAITGRGNFPLRSAWLTELQSAGVYHPVSLLYRDRATDTVAPWTDWFFEAASGGGAIAGVAAQALAGVTSVAAGVALIQAGASSTLAGIASSSAGTLKVQGAASATLGSVTQIAAGAVRLHGASSVGLGSVASAATGVNAAAAAGGGSASSLGARVSKLRKRHYTLGRRASHRPFIRVN